MMRSSGSPAERLVRVIDAILIAFAVIAGMMLAFQAVAVAGDALMRAVGSPIRWVHEVTTYLLIAVAMLAAPYGLRRRAHFRVTILIDRLSTATQRRLELGLYLLAAASFAVFAVYSADIALTAFERGLRAPTLLRTPLFIPQAALPVGSSLLFLACLAEILTLTSRRRGPGDEGAESEPVRR